MQQLSSDRAGEVGELGAKDGGWPAVGRAGPWRRPKRAHLVWWVAAITGLFAVGGMRWLALNTRATAEKAALQAHADHAAAFANLLGGRELAAGVPGPGAPIDEPTREELDRLLAEALREPDTGLDDAALQVLAPGGRVLYSTTPAEQGAFSASAVPALREGESAARFRAPTGLEHWSRVFELDMAFGSGPAPNVLRLSGPAWAVTAPVADDIRRAQLREMAAVALLWVGQVGVVWVLSHRLRRHAHRSEYLAHHDTLTGLPNRALFNAHLGDVVSAARETGGRVGLLVVDLNRFKELNDTLGHHSGDAVLRAVAWDIAGELSAADMVARMGGDEFAIVVDRPASVEAVEEVAERVSAALARRPHLGELAVTADAAIGVAVFPDHGVDAAMLMRKADLAMYAAKAARRPWLRYEDSITAPEVSTLTLPTELRTALSTGSSALSAHYQPIVDTHGQLVAVRAVPRWSHPTRGLLDAAAFVPLAERIGVDWALTAHIVDVVLAQAAAWCRQGVLVPVAVGFGAGGGDDDGLGQLIATGLDRHGLGPDSLIVALSAGPGAGRPDRAVGGDAVAPAGGRHGGGHTGAPTEPAPGSTVEVLRRLGVSIALDRFGSDRSSLAALRDVPAEFLELDAGLLADLASTGPTREIVRSTVALGHRLGMVVVAAGIDRLEQLDLLVECGCDWLHGPLIGPPMPAEDLGRWMAVRRPTAPAPGGGDLATAPWATTPVG